MSNEQEIPPNQTTLSCKTQARKFHWLKARCQTAFRPNIYCYPKEPEPFTVSVQVGWAGKCFRAACCLQSVLTSQCDHSFHITGSFTASLTANRFACRQISDISLNCLIFQIMTHKQTRRTIFEVCGQSCATIQRFITEPQTSSVLQIPFWLNHVEAALHANINPERCASFKLTTRHAGSLRRLVVKGYWLKSKYLAH